MAASKIQKAIKIQKRWLKREPIGPIGFYDIKTPRDALRWIKQDDVEINSHEAESLEKQFPKHFVFDNKHFSSSKEHSLYDFSNYRVWKRDFEKTEGRNWWTVDTDSFLVRRDEKNPTDEEEAIDGLDGYPILDEDDHSNLEMEVQDEDWESYGRDDLRREIGEKSSDKDQEIVDTLMNSVTDEMLDNFAYEARQEGDKYPEMEGSSTIFPDLLEEWDGSMVELGDMLKLEDHGYVSEVMLSAAAFDKGRIILRPQDLPEAVRGLINSPTPIQIMYDAALCSSPYLTCRWTGKKEIEERQRQEEEDSRQQKLPGVSEAHAIDCDMDEDCRCGARENPVGEKLPPDVVAAFMAIAHQQRGAPEEAMIAVQMYHGGGVLSPVIEHVGDITHRMTHWASYSGHAYEIHDKVDKTLRSLTHGYGFAREHHENMVNNAEARGELFITHRKKVTQLLEVYAAEHSKIPVYNRPQWLAREAAVALGHQQWQQAVGYLSELKQTSDLPIDEYTTAVYAFERDKNSKLKLYEPAQGVQENPTDDEYQREIRISAPLAAPKWLRQVSVPIHSGRGSVGDFVEARVIAPGPIWQDIFADAWDSEEHQKDVGFDTDLKTSEAAAEWFIEKVEGKRGGPFAAHDMYIAAVDSLHGYQRRLYGTVEAGRVMVDAKKIAPRIRVFTGTIYKLTTMRELFQLFTITHHGSTVWLYDFDTMRPDRVLTLWELIQFGAEYNDKGELIFDDTVGYLETDVDSPEEGYIRKKLWPASEKQWEEGQFAPPELGGPSSIPGMFEARENPTGPDDEEFLRNYETPKLYEYGATLRPPDHSTVPQEGWTGTRPSSVFKHGVVQYSRYLTQQEIDAFQLVALDPYWPANMRKGLDAYTQMVINEFTSYNPEGYSITDSLGTRVLSNSTRPGIDFQVTDFDTNMIPTGHRDYNDFAEAVREEFWSRLTRQETERIIRQAVGIDETEARENPTGDDPVTRAVEIFGTTDDPNEAAFILPDGRFLKRRDTHDAMAANIMDRPRGRGRHLGLDPVASFLEQTGSVRIVTARLQLALEVRGHDFTQSQRDTLKELFAAYPEAEIVIEDSSIDKFIDVPHRLRFSGDGNTVFGRWDSYSTARENPVEESGATWLFSYGSNHPAQLAERLDHRVATQGAVLADHVRVFRGWSQRWGGGVASLQAKKGGEVYGLVAKVTDDDLAQMDRFEGLASGNYKRKNIEVTLADGESVNAVAYVSTSTKKNAPTREYLEAVAKTIGAHWQGDGGAVSWRDITVREAVIR